MRISAIVAMSKNRVIGKNNKMPWHLPADLEHFKRTTFGKPILMGRKTYESIGRPLPDRYNVVISRDKNFTAKGCLVVSSVDEALAAVKDDAEVFIIGGAMLYQQMMPRIERLYLTVIHQEFEGDTFFPEYDEKKWAQIARVDFVPDEINKYAYSFIVLDKK